MEHQSPAPTSAAEEEPVASTSAAAASGSSEEVISGQKVAVQAAEKVITVRTRSIAIKGQGHAPQTEAPSVDSGPQRKRAAPTCQYYHEQGHRNSVRCGCSCDLNVGQTLPMSRVL